MKYVAAPPPFALTNVWYPICSGSALDLSWIKRAYLFLQKLSPYGGFGSHLNCTWTYIILNALRFLPGIFSVFYIMYNSWSSQNSLCNTDQSRRLTYKNSISQIMMQRTLKSNKKQFSPTKEIIALLSLRNSVKSIDRATHYMYPSHLRSRAFIHHIWHTLF